MGSFRKNNPTRLKIKLFIKLFINFTKEVSKQQLIDATMVSAAKNAMIDHPSPDEEVEPSNKTLFICSGTNYKPAAKANLTILNTLPVGTYNIGIDNDGFSLCKIDDFSPHHGKIYGELPQQANRILSTFQDRASSTGVLLAGEKGSGKTLLTKTVSMMAAKLGIPTIVVNTPLKGESFNTFLQLIEQPTVMIFDEYEKVYSRYGDQEKLLTLLDGVYPSKKLFLLTTNSRWGIDSHMLNRPGRLFYVIKFTGLNLEFVKGYAESNLKNPAHVQKVCVVAAIFGAFNLDMLKGLVEEMNRYNESPGQSLKWLNVNPEFDGGHKYTLEWKKPDGTPVVLHETDFEGNPLKEGVTVKAKDDKADLKISVDATHFNRLEIATKALVFSKGGNEIVVTRKIKKDFDWEMLGMADGENNSTAMCLQN